MNVYIDISQELAQKIHNAVPCAQTTSSINNVWTATGVVVLGPYKGCVVNLCGTSSEYEVATLYNPKTGNLTVIDDKIANSIIEGE